MKAGKYVDNMWGDLNAAVMFCVLYCYHHPLTCWLTFTSVLLDVSQSLVHSIWLNKLKMTRVYVLYIPSSPLKQSEYFSYNYHFSLIFSFSS